MKQSNNRLDKFLVIFRQAFPLPSFRKSNSQLCSTVLHYLRFRAVSLSPLNTMSLSSRSCIIYPINSILRLTISTMPSIFASLRSKVGRTKHLCYRRVNLTNRDLYKWLDCLSLIVDFGKVRVTVLPKGTIYSWN
jgi:hypothetical protein